MRKERTIKAIRNLNAFCLAEDGCLARKCPYKIFCDRVMNVGEMPYSIYLEPYKTYKKLKKLYK